MPYGSGTIVYLTHPHINSVVHVNKLYIYMVMLIFTGQESKFTVPIYPFNLVDFDLVPPPVVSCDITCLLLVVLLFTCCGSVFTVVLLLFVICLCVEWLPFHGMED